MNATHFIFGSKILPTSSIQPTSSHPLENKGVKQLSELQVHRPWRTLGAGTWLRQAYPSTSEGGGAGDSGITKPTPVARRTNEHASHSIAVRLPHEEESRPTSPSVPFGGLPSDMPVQARWPQRESAERGITQFRSRPWLGACVLPYR